MHNENFSKVSFVIPTLNASKFLPKCLSSIRSQNYPLNKVEIIVADGGSEDSTRDIAKSYGAIVIDNPEVLHEPGKTLASSKATGKIIFYTDSDNILANPNWIKIMTKPIVDNPKVMGILPQTEPPPDSNSINRYLGYLFTDPLTWFIYQNSANPKYYEKSYRPIKKTKDYKIYRFELNNLPLFGLSQGVGVSSKFKRDDIGKDDDLLAGIKLIKEGGLIAYVPKAGVYHYHVESLGEFVNKYTWRVRNNLNQEVKGMGIINRQKYLVTTRRLRQFIFPLYSLTLFFPLFDSFMLYRKNKDWVMFWHLPICIILSLIIVKEVLFFLLGIRLKPGQYRR